MTIEYRSYTGQGVVEHSRIIKAGTASGTVTKATGPTDFLLGTSDTQVDHIDGEQVDLELRPIGTVKLGGAVAFGAPITSDANGKGVTAAPAAGANVRIIGFALATGVLDDEISYLREPGFMQG